MGLYLIKIIGTKYKYFTGGVNFFYALFRKTRMIIINFQNFWKINLCHLRDKARQSLTIVRP